MDYKEDKSEAADEESGDTNIEQWERDQKFST